MKGFNVYQKLRTERMNVRQVGPRLKKAEEEAKKAEEDAKTAKMKAAPPGSCSMGYREVF